MTKTLSPDVVVVGAGNAALCAALAAEEKGQSVLVLERAPEAERGGNSRFTAGAMRVVYDDVSDLQQLMPELTESEIANTDFGAYTRDEFYDDMGRVTQYRSDPDLTEALIEGSFSTLKWMNRKGVRFMPMYGRQAFKVDGKFKFWGGLTVEAWGGGEGLISQLHDAACKRNIRIEYEARALKLVTDDTGITSVEIKRQGKTEIIRCKAIILASGGFEANSEWRTRYLGPGWELAKVRGTRFNTGDGLKMAIDIGAATTGNWSGCHAVGWDRNAPEFGDLDVGDGFQKHSYPLGIMVNANGERFVDEGADFRNYTYAKYGREVLMQPQQFAWQVFDARVADLLRDEYRIRQATRVQSDTLDGLADKLEGVDGQVFLDTVLKYNNAIDAEVKFDPTVKDGRGTEGLKINKSNWANPLDMPPYVAYQITCGITFTFGGLKVDKYAQVIDDDGHVIQGLYAAGELVGGLFYFNYPGGTGLTSGAVFGKIAGASAGDYLNKS
ncbi:MAG: FAD-dependent tricarballylate dehydrogenase TcuA [bacterium]|nr:FAD-binding dehydrogenase [Gammaproteobacteria bacterium]HIL94470.1 FAD-binding dehydrogenase [Pseudomonadales bacterium]